MDKRKQSNTDNMVTEEQKNKEYTSLAQTAVNQSYEQYINPPDAELHKRLEEMKEALEKSTRHIPCNKETDKEAEEYINQQPKHVFTMPIYEDSNYLLKVRIRELEEQIVTYCRENPAAEEWFGITVKRD